MLRAVAILAGVATVAAVIVGLAGDTGDPFAPAVTTAATTEGSRPPSAPRPRRPSARPRPAPRRPQTALRRARCPAGLANCAAVTGRVLFIESVDPDGDGDLHVIAAGGSVTAPGITVFDISRALRPRHDPRPGDRVTGAGPVFRGSHGQRQIQVVEFRVARR